MFLIGMSCSSFVNILSGAVSLGIFCLSPFAVFAFLDLGIAFGLRVISVCFGDVDAVILLLVRVAARLDSSPLADLGVSGENRAWSFYYPLAMSPLTLPETHLPICGHTNRWEKTLSAVHNRPGG